MAKVLIIDDSAFMRMQLTVILEKAGHQVIQAGDGAMGVRMAAADKPDCVILDLLMPDMPGMHVINAFKLKKIDNPLIIHTVDIQESTRDACLKLGAKHFLNKPPQDDKIVQVVQAVIG